VCRVCPHTRITLRLNAITCGTVIIYVIYLFIYLLYVYKFCWILFCGFVNSVDKVFRICTASPEADVPILVGHLATLVWLAYCLCSLFFSDATAQRGPGLPHS
jgi:hypothetical protein